MHERHRVLIVSFVFAAACGSLALACEEDDQAGAPSSGAAGDAGTTPVDSRGGSTPPSEDDSGAAGDSATQPLPGTGLVLPRDAFLLTNARPLNLDTETEVVVGSSLQYFTAYYDSVPSNQAEKYRFVARSHDTGEEVPSGGIRVWWRKISSTTGEATYYICREGKDVSGEIRYAVKVETNAATAAEPDSVFRNQCSWTLWKHPTDDAWAIRAPKGVSTAEKGMVVTKQHASATEGYRIRVEGSFIDEAPFFRFKSMM